MAGRYASPWVMAPINTRIVRKSNAMLGDKYGGLPCCSRAFRQGRLWPARSVRGTAGSCQTSTAACASLLLATECLVHMCSLAACSACYLPVCAI